MEDKLTQIPLSELVESKTNPRKVFTEESLKELSESIKQNGVINPILVRKINYSPTETASVSTDDRRAVFDLYVEDKLFEQYGMDVQDIPLSGIPDAYKEVLGKYYGNDDIKIININRPFNITRVTVTVAKEKLSDFWHAPGLMGIGLN